MDASVRKLVQDLRSAGLSEQAIRAAWPAWWTDEAEGSKSAQAELRFALARKLGLAPKPLLGDRVDFVWKSGAHFKHLTTEDAQEQAALTSFGMTVGRLLIQASEVGLGLPGRSAVELRTAILTSEPFVDLSSLLATCWSLGVPVIQLRVFPLASKRMHAMVITDKGRHAVLLARSSTYPASIAFSLAHEIGHIALNHFEGSSAIIDLKDPAESDDVDPQEFEADEYALSILTGSKDPDIRTNIDGFSARALATAVLETGPQFQIEPGTLALCLAYRKRSWPTAMASMKYIYSEAKLVSEEVNKIAKSQIDWDLLPTDSAEFLMNIMLEND